MLDDNALKQGWRDMLRLYPMPLFVTLQFNDVVEKGEARRSLRLFFNEIDRELIGSRYKNRPKQRTKYIAIQELGRKNHGTHFHLIVNPAHGKLDQFKEMGPQIWRQIWKKGSADIKELPTSKDFERVTSYMTKEAFKRDVRDSIIFDLS